jgi:hypothetical protein
MFLPQALTGQQAKSEEENADQSDIELHRDLPR